MLQKYNFYSSKTTTDGKSPLPTDIFSRDGSYIFGIFPFSKVSVFEHLVFENGHFLKYQNFYMLDILSFKSLADYCVLFSKESNF